LILIIAIFLRSPTLSIAVQSPFYRSNSQWEIDLGTLVSNIYGNNDPTDTCFQVNNRQALGPRSGIENACGIDLNDYQPSECLKLYQSFLCTASCPQYGEPSRFNVLCYDVYARLESACGFGVPGNGPTMLDCLQDLARVPYGVADKGDEDCSRPHLIPVDGPFERDYCLYGNTESICVAHACLIKKVTTFNPAQWGPGADPNGASCWNQYYDTYPWPNAPATPKIRGGVAPIVTLPYCGDKFETCSPPCFNPVAFDHIYDAYEITSPAGPGGASCDDELNRLVDLDYQGAMGKVFLYPNGKVPSQLVGGDQVVALIVVTPGVGVCAGPVVYDSHHLDYSNCIYALGQTICQSFANQVKWSCPAGG